MMQDWQQIGAKMTINNMPAAVIWGEFYVRSKFDSLLVGTAFRTGRRPRSRHSLRLGRDPRQGRRGGNHMQWQNAEADKP
jgi:peptide/nickel transport system substrate-binding protein